MRKLAQICKIDTVLCADNQYVEGGVMRAIKNL